MAPWVREVLTVILASVLTGAISGYQSSIVTQEVIKTELAWVKLTLVKHDELISALERKFNGAF